MKKITRKGEPVLITIHNNTIISRPRPLAFKGAAKPAPELNEQIKR
jgi:hypothetical protein